MAGNIEAVSGYDWHCDLDEEGNILNVAANRRAAQLVLEETGVLTDVHCGNAVFLGETDDGGEADVSEEFIDLAQQLFGLHQPVSCPKTVAGPAGPVTAGGPPPWPGPASGCWRRTANCPVS